MTPQIHRGLDARYRAGRRYVLAAPFEYQSEIPEVGRFVIPAGFVTNGHSVPRVFWSILPPEDWMESAVAHDYAYAKAGVLDSQSGELRPLTRELADRLHREVLIHVGGGERRANLMFRILRAAGWKAWNDYRSGRKAEA